MKTKFISFFAIATLFSFGSFATNVAVLDIEQIVKESSAMRDIQSKITKKQEEYQKEINKKQTSLEDKQKAIEGKKSILSKEAFETEVKAFEKEVDDLRNVIDKKQGILKKASMEAMNKVNDKVKDIITDISKEKKFDVVISSTQAVYYDDSLDISAEVLKRLNKKITKVDVKFE